ncbi:hypothetical protein Agub_g2485 [Astrephomene gubernaculifera]|uniref:Calmodulin n=1 Tax=Astrephomene gubernaculifera TaxID=47775 RepID=A0AAD3HIB5_9CHLO|nr:hypothetical protein Agub_g2485 [Astrephomene gubernaculifera]
MRCAVGRHLPVSHGRCQPRTAILHRAHHGCNRRAQLVGATPTTPSGGIGGLSILRNTKLVDRLRFQAILVFKQFDTDGRGKLTLQQLEQYGSYSAERLGPAAAAQLQPLLEAARSQVAASPDGLMDMEAFIELVREQIKAAAALPDFPRTLLGEAAVRQLSWDSSLPPPELGSVLAVFKLLDFNGDEHLALEDLRKAQGIEREIVADKLEDADTNEDGFLSFKDFLTSYAKERPVILNMLVLAAHSATFWFILNLPALELPIKAVMCLALIVKPQLITAPVIKIYTIIRTVVDRARAEIEMAGRAA